jgi:aminopeptidase
MHPPGDVWARRADRSERRQEDPRVEDYAALLVDRCIDPQPGWQVLVATTVEARPLASALSRLLAARGAWCLQRIALGAAFPVDLDWLEAAPPELAGRVPPLEQDVLDRVDASIFVLAPAEGRHPATPEAAAAVRALSTAYRDRGRRGEIPSVRCDFPCPAYAARAGLSLADFEELFYEACLRDWDAEAASMRPVLERFDRAQEVRVRAPETDLTLSLAGRRGAIDDGHLNVPGGEVYYSPVEDSAEGEIRFDVPTVSVGGPVEGIRLRFRAGEVVDASAELGEELLHAALETDAGARRIGELGLGCNAGIDRPLRNVLFDEKMAGTVHLALGYGFPPLGSRNESSHWDLVRDLRRGGELLVDGEVVQRDGSWLLG